MSVCQRSFIVKRMQAWINTIGLLDSTSPLRRTSAAAAKRCRNGCEPVCVSSAAAG
jgi:hypothetical protein